MTEYIKPIVFCYVAYIAINLALIFLVGKVFSRNCRVFLAETYSQNEKLVHSVTQLLLAGFYFVNLGFMTLYLWFWNDGFSRQFIEKIGAIFLSLGGTVFLQVFILSRMRKKQNES